MAANREALAELTAAAAARARVVVLPELATTGYVVSRSQAAAWAEPLDGPSVTRLAAAARAGEAVVVMGLILRDPQGELRNAQVVLDADGSVAGTYAKHHLWGADFGWAAAGPSPGAVAPTRAGRVGLLICHDVVYPRTVHALAGERPDLLAFSTAWVGDGEDVPSSWVAAAAALRGAPLVVANRGGREGACVFGDASGVLTRQADGAVAVALGERCAAPYVVFTPRV